MTPDIEKALETVAVGLERLPHMSHAVMQEYRAALSTIREYVEELEQEGASSFLQDELRERKMATLRSQRDTAVAVLREIDEGRPAFWGTQGEWNTNPAYKTGDDMARIAREALARLSTPKELETQ